MSRPNWGVAPIACAKRECDWYGKETDLVSVLRPGQDDKRIKISDNVCPKCGCTDYRFTRRKRSAHGSSYSTIEPLPESVRSGT